MIPYSSAPLDAWGSSYPSYPPHPDTSALALLMLARQLSRWPFSPVAGQEQRSPPLDPPSSHPPPLASPARYSAPLPGLLREDTLKRSLHQPPGFCLPSGLHDNVLQGSRGFVAVLHFFQDLSQLSLPVLGRGSAQEKDGFGNELRRSHRQTKGVKSEGEEKGILSSVQTWVSVVGSSCAWGHEGLVPSKWHQVAILGLKKAERFCFLVMHRRATWETMHRGRFMFHAEMPLNTCEIQEQINAHSDRPTSPVTASLFASSNLGGLLCPSWHFYFSFLFGVP